MKIHAIVLQSNASTDVERIKKAIENLGGDVVQPMPATWLMKSEMDSASISIAINDILNEAQQVLVLEVNPAGIISMAPELAPSLHGWLQKHY